MRWVVRVCGGRLYLGQEIVQELVDERGLARDVALQGVRGDVQPGGEGAHRQALRSGVAKQVVGGGENRAPGESGALTRQSRIHPSTGRCPACAVRRTAREGGGPYGTIALFHSVLGLRPGITAAARRLREQGHAVFPVEQYEGRVFDDYDEAGAFAGALGFPELMLRALTAVESLPDGFLCVGFSNGGGMAEHVALHRSTAGVVMCSGALPLSMLGTDAWPAGVPAQIHVAARDPFR